MDPVNGLNQIMQVLRRRLGKSAPDSNRPSKPATKPATGTRTTVKPGSDEILRRIGDRIHALNPDEKRGTKAMQIFIESVLVWEFGEELLQDPRFTEIAREVQHTINENELARQKLTTLLEQL